MLFEASSESFHFLGLEVPRVSLFAAKFTLYSSDDLHTVLMTLHSCPRQPDKSLKLFKIYLDNKEGVVQYVGFPIEGSVSFVNFAIRRQSRILVRLCERAI